MAESAPLVAVLMGSKSDWEAMRQADELLSQFEIPHESRILSAHRTPDLAAEYARGAAGRGIEVIIAGAGGAAHLAGAIAANTVLPVIGVPLASSTLNGLDALLATVQMPKGVPVATVAIGPSGAANAALLAVAILATSRASLRERLIEYRRRMADAIRGESLP
jgi:5-(carboxyamino)imidazole ribonucleotide mutase